MNRPSWAPDGVDIEQPSAARLYDYALGGSHNFAVDRELFRQLILEIPDLVAQAQANRAFLRRAVRYCLANGVRQFLDIGSGIPTRGAVHELAQQSAPPARVVYVDTDPVAVAHSRALLRGNDRVVVLQADLRDPRQIVDHAEVRTLLDFRQPVAVLLVAMLHLIPDEDEPTRMIAELRDRLVPGSYLVVSHAAWENRPSVMAEGLRALRRGGVVATARSRAEIETLFTGFELVQPGLVSIPLWQPEEPVDSVLDPGHSFVLAGVGRKT